MKKSLKWKLVAGLAAVGSLFTLAGCKLGESLADVLDKYELTARVTYYANSVGGDDEFKTDGQFENTQGVKDVYYQTGSYAARIGEKAIPNVSLTHYAHSFEGWYYVEEDEQGRLLFEDENGESLYQGEDGELYYINKEGNPVLDDDTISTVPVRSEEKVDFSKALAEGDHWSICADWEEMSRLHIKLVCDELGEGEKIEGVSLTGESVSYADGDIVWEDFFDGEEDTIQALGIAPFIVTSAHTYVEYYTSEACEEFVSWPIAWKEEDQVVYVKFIKGEWNILKNAEDVGKYLTSASSNNYLIADIDCTGTTVAPITTFSGTLQGNGFKIKNLNVTQAAKDVALGRSYALFGDIKSTAKIENITFENVNYTIATSPTITTTKMYFLFTSLTSGATVVNVKISGKFTINYTSSIKPENAENADTDENWWKYGSYEGAESAFAGFDMSGVTVAIVDPSTNA